MAASKRSVEVDFFRGLALLVIMLDHIPHSALSHITLHNYAFCDAAEVFVFVGGYSVAAAYTAIAARQGESAATWRFIKRSWEIYRAFLLTAALMLTLGIVLHSMQLDTPATGATEAATFVRRPFGMLMDIASLRRQPFLSSVLPMYALFALCAPLILRLAKGLPWLALGCSALVWLLAEPLARYLPSAYPEGWAFNPFAWQFLFVLGAVSRLMPITRAFLDTDNGRKLTVLACAAVILFALWQLFLTFTPSPGYEKQNLALLRLLNFGALAWCATWMSQKGWVAKVADRLPTVVKVGQQSLACFVGGACISVAVDGFSRPFMPSLPTWLGAGLSDVVAITLLLALASVMASLKARQARQKASSRLANSKNARHAA